jgi:hypothetical protein
MLSHLSEHLHCPFHAAMHQRCSRAEHKQASPATHSSCGSPATFCEIRRVLCRVCILQGSQKPLSITCVAISLTKTARTISNDVQCMFGMLLAVVLRWQSFGGAVTLSMYCLYKYSTNRCTGRNHCWHLT